MNGGASDDALVRVPPSMRPWVLSTSEPVDLPAFSGTSGVFSFVASGMFGSVA